MDIDREADMREDSALLSPDMVEDELNLIESIAQDFVDLANKCEAVFTDKEIEDNLVSSEEYLHDLLLDRWHEMLAQSDTDRDLPTSKWLKRWKFEQRKGRR